MFFLACSGALVLDAFYSDSNQKQPVDGFSNCIRPFIRNIHAKACITIIVNFLFIAAKK